MRVLQLVQKPQRRGAEIFASQLNKWLTENGHVATTLYLYEYNGDKPLRLEDGDVCLDGVERSRRERFPGIQTPLLRNMRRAIQAFSPDVVQANGGRTVKYAAAAKAVGCGRARLVYRNIDSPLYWAGNGVKARLFRHAVMPHMDGVVGVSQRTLREAKRLYRLSAPSTFIPNAVDLGRLQTEGTGEAVRQQHEASATDVVVLFVGNLTRQKRPDRFLRVLRRAVDACPTIIGWLLGGGPSRSALEAQAELLQLNERVRFLGYQDAVAPYMKASDFIVSTSDTEGIPAAVLEAAYLKRPVVGTRVGGMTECVADGRTGYLVPAVDEGRMTERIVELGRNPELRRQLGEQAHERCRQVFSMTRVGPQYLEFYQRLLQWE